MRPEGGFGRPFSWLRAAPLLHPCRTRNAPVTRPLCACAIDQSTGLMMRKPSVHALRDNLSRARSRVTSQRAPWASARSMKTWSSASVQTGLVTRGVGVANIIDS